MNNIKLFEEQKVRTAWDSDKEMWYISIVDVIAVLTESIDPAAYWRKLKQRLKAEGNQTVTDCHGLKMRAVDGKMRMTDVADTEQLFRLIQSIPSPKAEPFKLWLAQIASERLDEIQDPELTIDRALEQYLQLKEEGFIFKGQSYLFWEYIRVLTEIRKYNPNVKFLLENVVMDPKWKEIFDKTLGVEGVLINSNLVSAQNRKRFYWTNICTIEQPEDLNINLQDILEETLDWNKASIVGRKMTSEGVRKDNNKDLKLYQCLEVKKTMQNKSNCLTTFSKDNVLTPMPIGRYYDCYNRKLPYRNYTIKEYCRLQNVSDDYFYDNDKLIVSVSSLRKMLGNGWTINVIKHILKNLK